MLIFHANRKSLRLLGKVYSFGACQDQTSPDRSNDWIMIVSPFDAERGRVLQSSACTDNNIHILPIEAPSLNGHRTNRTGANIQPQTQNEGWLCTIKHCSINIPFELYQQATLVAAINSDDAPCPSMHTGRYPIPQSFETVFGRQCTSCSLPWAPPQKFSCLFLLIRFIR